MTSKEELKELLYYANLNFERENERKTEFSNKIEQMGVADNEESFKIIEKDLDRLEKLEKAIEIILKYKIRPSTFVFTIKNYREMYGKDLTLEKAYILLDFCGTQEEYELLKEVLENESVFNS